MGRHEVGFVENTVKTPLGDEGCLFEARFHINKIPGNFHLSTHSVDVQPDRYDFAHEIHEISFGSKIRKISSKNIRSSFNPLKSRSKLDGSNLESHEYVMRIVPTTYEDISGGKLTAYQYTYAYRSHISFGHGGRVIPALWFKCKEIDHFFNIYFFFIFRRPEPHHSEVSRVPAPSLPLPHHHLRHCRGNLHSRRHHRLLHLLSNRNIQEVRVGQAELNQTLSSLLNVWTCRVT